MKLLRVEGAFHSRVMGSAASAPAVPLGGGESSKLLLSKLSGRTLEGTRPELESLDVNEVAQFVESVDYDDAGDETGGTLGTTSSLSAVAAAVLFSNVDGAAVATCAEAHDGSVAPLLASLGVDAPFSASFGAIEAAFAAWQSLPRAADRRKAKRLRTLIMGSPALVQQANALQMELNSLPEAERAALLETRRARMREQAAKAVEAYARLPDHEKTVFTDGEIELYSPENQAIRGGRTRGPTSDRSSLGQSFRLMFRRAIVSRSGLERFLGRRARGTPTSKRR